MAAASSGEHDKNDTSSVSAGSSIIALAESYYVAKTTLTIAVFWVNGRGVIALERSAGFAAVTVPPNSGCFLAAYVDNSVVVWAAYTGDRVLTLEVDAVAVAIDGSMLAVGTSTALMLFDVHEGTVPIASIELTVNSVHFGEHKIMSTSSTPALYLGTAIGPLFVYAEAPLVVFKCCEGVHGESCSMAVGNHNLMAIVNKSGLIVVSNGDPVVSRVISGSFVRAAVCEDRLLSVRLQGDKAVMSIHTAPSWLPIGEVFVHPRSPVLLTKEAAYGVYDRIVELRA